MRFHSLESRIVTLFLVLILLVQLAGFVAIKSGIDQNARASIHDEIVVGERVFQLLLDQNAQKLTQGASLLALDHGFRSAIATSDRETIASAMQNGGDRISAALVLLIGLDRHVSVATRPELARSLENAMLPMVDRAEQSGSAVGAGIAGGHAYQIVIVPVRAPVTTIGWVAMAFPVDQKLAGLMRELSSLHVSILTRDRSLRWMPDATTLSAADAASLTTQMQAQPSGARFISDLAISDSQYSAGIVKLAQQGDQTAVAVLQRSISEAIAPYRQLQFNLLILTVIGIVVAFAGSIFTAKRITGPLRQLAETAKRLGTGDYRGQIAIRRDDEIGDLSTAFESMREGIANRELEIRRLAYWDTLTDLPNRAQFRNLLNEAITQARQNNESFHILMMDLDRFKNVNDVLGHGFGDALLREVASRLKHQLLADTDLVARLGGDEFVVLLPKTKIEAAIKVATRILKSFEIPISLEDQTVDLGAGIGIATFPEHGTEAESLLSRAEVAMYAAKRSGNEAVVYDPALDKTSQQSLSLLSELRNAADQNEFRLYVQPKILLSTGAVIGVEALVRWIHPQKGLIFPDHFIPFAETSGFIRVLTRWVLEQSAILCRDLAQQGAHPKISVNLSARDLLDHELPVKFLEVLKRHQVPMSSFCLEITESSIMDDPIRALQTLEGLHAMGVELSIDDFGTGYSSLAYLKRLPVDELKIDKSFVLNMERDADDAKIVRSTIDLGHNMGLRVVAEGIESKAVWDILAKMGCDQAQGYFISKPMPSDQFLGWMRTWTPPPHAPHEECAPGTHDA